MQISYPSFDQLVTEYFADVYRLCFLLTDGRTGAWQTTFQTFLYMGAISEPFADKTAEQDAIFYWCIRTCTDYYYRKIRRRPRRERFSKDTPFPVSDNLWELLGMPFQKKAAVFFICYLGFTPERTRHILNKKAALPAINGMDPELQEKWKQAVSSIAPAADGAAQLSGEAYLRFEERNVPLENRLRGIRCWWDHAVIWIAAAILVLFAAAAYYTSGIGL